MHLKIASRSSDLARWQAYKVAEKLKDFYPDVEIAFEFRSSFGDQNLDIPLAQMESRGVFTQDFFQDLKAGKFDLVVHSWKDLPVEEREGVEVVATIERADVRDILLVPKEVWAEAKRTKKLNILTSSPRRQYNLSPWLHRLLPAYQGEIEFLPVRGNIPSRLDKMFDQNAGLIMAKAALDRMLSGGEHFAGVQERIREKVSQCHFMVFPLELNPCAPAQGALAIEIASHREDLKEILAPISDDVTFRNVEMERDILKSYGGGCHQKIGVSRVEKLFGVYHVEKGESDWGTKLHRKELLKNPPSYSFRELTKENIFPLNPKDNDWFEREGMEVKEDELSGRALLVARVTESLPPLHKASQVWAAGLATWLKLAKEGYWVHGCLEGLGEREIEWVGPLADHLQWRKLSHIDSTKSERLETLPYYRLKKKAPEDSPNLKGKKVFFWMSSTSFERALELYPEEIQSGFHSCGPGLTFEVLKGHPALKEAPQVFLSLEEFHNYLKQSGIKF